MTTLQITLISILLATAVIALVILSIALYRNKKIVLRNCLKANKIVYNYNVWLLNNSGLEKFHEFHEKRLPGIDTSAKLYLNRMFDFRKWEFKDFFPELVDYEHFYNEEYNYEDSKWKSDNDGETG